jgi:hypothetical protein
MALLLSLVEMKREKEKMRLKRAASAARSIG